MSDFDDLLEANQRFSESFDLAGFDGIAKAGVALVTCMDSRLDPLGMVGMKPGDAKILRNPGGRVTDQALAAVVLSVAVLNVERVLVVEHTRCAMASSTEEELQQRVGAATGSDASWMTLGAITDQEATVRGDVHRVRSHPLIGDHVAVGGFIYDVDTGLLRPVD